MNDKSAKIIKNAPLGEISWFRTGGRADNLFLPANTKELADFLINNPDEEITTLGSMANTIIRDGGIAGTTIRLGQNGFSKTKQVDKNLLYAQTGALNGTVAAAAAKAEIGGLEFLSGIPGTLGGALSMNAGAYGVEIKDIVKEVHAIDRGGKKHIFSADNMGFSYRHCAIAHDFIFIGALVCGTSKAESEIWDDMSKIKRARRSSQPIKEHTGGSTFANPSIKELEAACLAQDTKAWRIVERVGGRGLRVGGACMSEKHCNFMVNCANASARDLEMLGNEIRKRAAEELGIILRWEIKRIGREI